jgi:HEPN domain-containing protein
MSVYTGQSLLDELLELSQSMEEKIADMEQHGIKASQADRTYRMEKAKKIAELKSGGWPATITEAMANGHLIVADARCERETNDTQRDAAKESLQTMKRKYDLLRSIWERENR